MGSRGWIRWVLSLLVFAFFLLHTSGLRPFRLLEQLENFTYDARTTLTLSGTGDARVVILDIDEKSIAAEGQWPWSRDKLAQLVETLFDRYRIKVLGFDAVFSEADRSSLDLAEKLAGTGLDRVPGVAEKLQELQGRFDHDRRLAQALQGRAVVLGSVFRNFIPEGEPARVGRLCAPLMDKSAASLYAVDWVRAAGYTANLPELQDAAPLCGFFDNPRVDGDGVYRRVPLVQQYEGAIYPSLALALVRAALGNPAVDFEFEPPDARTSLNLERLHIGKLSVPVDEDVAAYVPYRGPYKTMTYVPATDVLQGTADPARLNNAIVILGTSAAGLLDFRTTPVGRGFAGVEVHANLVSGILDGRVRQKAPYYSGIEAVLLLSIALLLAWLFAKLSPLAAAAMVLALIGGTVAMAFGFWSQADFIMPLGVPVVFTLAVFTAHLLYGYFVESRRARGISRMFGEYVPPEIVAEMADKGGQISMEGEQREMTVLFSDVRGFTTISEKLDAKDLSELMNQFLTPLTKVIQKHRGTIDKYMGDAIMAFWGAPLPDQQHAFNALQAGLEMVRAVRELDEPFARRGWPPLNIGVGLNTGLMRVGNMGSEFRRAYTVMGDPVNLGSRVEGLTKEYGVYIICTEFVRAAAPSDWSFRELDLVRVKGKNEPVAIYEPLGPKEALDAGLRQDLARQRGAMKLYRAQAWDQAEAEFFNLSRSGRPHKVYELFLERIAYLRQNPPGADWDGAFTFTHK